MTTDPLALPRRAAIGLCAAPLLAAAPALAPLPEGATLLVAGPEGGETDRWADALGRAFASSRLRREAVGGADGVTGANQFEARTTPDGGTVMLAPGAAARAWLVGDARAQFDAARWLPLMAGVGSGVLVSRVAPQPGSSIRLAVGDLAGVELPGLLGLDLLGAAVEPVVGLSGATAREALAAGRVEAAYVRGSGAAGAVQALALAGIPALFTLGSLDDPGDAARDPAFPDLPSFPELFARRQSAGRGLLAAWRSLAAASAIDVALVLPRETPAAMVALWRRASAQAADSPDVQSMAASREARPLVAALAGLSASALAADPDSTLDLRRWLQNRWGWRPG